MIPRDVAVLNRIAHEHWQAGQSFYAELLAGLAEMDVRGYDLIEGASALGWGFVPGGSGAGGLTPWHALAELGRARLEKELGERSPADV
jgi:hypothetical protein